MASKVYHVFRWLYFRHLMPQKVWFFVYDRLHSKVDNQWRGERYKADGRKKNAKKVHRHR